MANQNAKIRARVEQMITASKRYPVEIAEKTVTVTRNAKGHPTGSVTRYVLEGHGVKNAFKRTYFRDTRVDALAAEGINVSMPRVKRGSNQVVVELVA